MSDADRFSSAYLDKAFRIEHICLMRLLGGYIGILMQREFDVSILQVDPDQSVSAQVIQREGAPPQSAFLLPIYSRGDEEVLAADAAELEHALVRVSPLVNEREMDALQLLTQRFANVQAKRKSCQVDLLTAGV